ncbi:MAG: hypothetical protein ACI9UQ_002573, partial [Candidatus Krumholzibacteriia bacterium]
GARDEAQAPAHMFYKETHLVIDNFVVGVDGIALRGL